ncbi:hypothetical protein V1477_012714 [Vespula maculifrons]|uniref:Secreted protein n=1 Tax=Vespula maculifrons TaxID=7453 RepID=A0ABD2BTV5_VESMC
MCFGMLLVLASLCYLLSSVAPKEENLPKNTFLILRKERKITHFTGPIYVSQGKEKHLLRIKKRVIVIL